MIRVEQHGRVVVITLDRPERRNAVDHATLLELLEAQRSIVERAVVDVRALVLTGEPPAFCAGADLAGVEQGAFATDLSGVLRGFVDLPVPVIAAVDGPALGAGTQLVVSCDLRVATPTSTFGVPAAKLGLAVDRWTIARVASEFSSPVARAMLVAAATYSGEDLHRIGGVHRLGDLDDAIDWAQQIAALAPITMQAHKVGLEAAGDDGDGRFQELFDRAWQSDDMTEGRTAFMEKRPPDFTGH